MNENEAIYPCGHNVVFYNIEDGTQRYIQGIEGTEGITALALSKSKKWLAVAEKHDKSPVCTVYNTQTLKKYKILVSLEIDKQKEYISMAFCPKNEKLLVCLTNEPQQQVIVWQVDRTKCVGSQPLAHPTGNVIGTQVSFKNTDQDAILITGNNTYKYYDVKSDGNLKCTFPQLSKKENNHLSSNYTAHCWLPDGNKFLVATD